MMDPNETLDELRKAFQRGDYVDLAQAFHALDEWIMKGGFLPEDWQEAQDAEKAALRAALSRPTYDSGAEVMDDDFQTWKRDAKDQV